VPLLLRLALAALIVAFRDRSRGLSQASWRASGRHGWLLRRSGPLLVAGGILLLAAARTHLHGDALLKLKLLATTSLRDDPYVWKEPLDSLLAHTAADGAATLGQPPEVAIALLSMLAGSLYLWSALYVGRLLGRTPWNALLIVIALLATGSSQLWFGHIENYSMVTAVCFLSITLAVGYLRGDKSALARGPGRRRGSQPASTGGLSQLPAMLLLLDRRRWKRQIGTLFLTGMACAAADRAAARGLGRATAQSRAMATPVMPQLFWTVEQATGSGAALAGGQQPLAAGSALPALAGGRHLGAGRPAHAHRSGSALPDCPVCRTTALPLQLSERSASLAGLGPLRHRRARHHALGCLRLA
jgi:hypothetical protein